MRNHAPVPDIFSVHQDVQSEPNVCKYAPIHIPYCCLLHIFHL
ncbi:hypothetical protein EVA_21062 [gut metagenome]|uniref:Uncharacterized protein n=1 Tax=gut metagenome TaxID=749906 RepID=J9F7F5_9ZZZZ